MKRLIGMKALVIGAGLCLLAGLLAAAEPAEKAPEVIWQEKFENFEQWKVSGPETLSAVLDKEFAKDETCLKYTFKIDDPTTGFSWPQQIRRLNPAIPLETNDCYMEFDAYYKPVKGSMTLILSLKEIADLKGVGFRLTPDAWTHVKVRLQGRKPGAKLAGYAFAIGRRLSKPDTEAVFYIKNIRIVHGEKF